jgi:23S rRNA pseudouridine1911/1915/1917 synthase
MAEDPTLRIEVPALLDGLRVDRAISLVTGVPRAAAAAAVDGGRVRLGGAVVRSGSRRLAEGDVLEVDPDPAGAGGLVGEPEVVVPVVHVDDELIVVDKPAGMVVHPGAGRQTGTMAGGLLARFPELEDLVRQGICDADRPGIVHRLDRGTSGLLVVARTPGAYHSLVAQLARRSVERRYVALVRGHLADDRGAVEAPIGRSTRTPTRMAVSATGKAARTRYSVLARTELPEPCTVLLVALDTGRTHQIRVHLAAIGHPVVGDDRYGPRLSGSAADSVGPALPGGRQFLHAAQLSLDHPGSGLPVSWSSPPGDDLEAVLPGLRAMVARGLAPSGDPGVSRP